MVLPATPGGSPAAREWQVNVPLTRNAGLWPFSGMLDLWLLGRGSLEAQPALAKTTAASSGISDSWDFVVGSAAVTKSLESRSSRSIA